MPPSPSSSLSVLVADEDRDALRSTEDVLRELGHEVVAYAIGLREAVEKIAAADPDAAVVVLHGDTGHALDLVDELSEVTRGPVLVVLDGEDPAFIAEAAERGVDAYARSETPAAVQSALELAIRRHAERERLAEQVDQLEGALGRRAVIERAKGVLMERHGLEERAAFERMRGHARSHQRTVVGVAGEVCAGALDLAG